MKKYPVLAMLAVLGSIVPLFISTSAFAQDVPYSEEHSDPAFYVPPINDGSLLANNNNEPAN